MAVDKIGITPGTGAFSATHKINEGGVDVHLQRTVPSTKEGVDVSVGSFVTIDVSVTRPANATTYSPGEVYNSTAPGVTGGLTFAGASRGDGYSGLIMDLDVFGTAAQSTPLEGELWLFDSAITMPADNAAFTPNITDLRKRVARIPFVMVNIGAVSHAEVSFQKGFTTVGSADLRGVPIVTNAYAPLSGEALTFRLSVMRTN